MAIVLAMLAVSLARGEEVVPSEQLGEVVHEFRANVGRPIGVFAANRYDTNAALALFDRGDFVFGLAGSPSEARPKDLGVDCALYLARRRVAGVRMWSLTRIGTCTATSTVVPAGEPLGPADTAVAIPVPPPPDRPPPPPLDIRRYKEGMGLANTSLVLAPVGVVTIVAGYYIGVTAWTDAGRTTGLVMIISGAVPAVLGPPFAAAGSLHSASALRRAGADVSTGLGTVALVTWAGTIIVPPAYIVSIAATMLQLSENRAAFRDLGGATHRVSLQMVPWTEHDARGLALVASF